MAGKGGSRAPHGTLEGGVHVGVRLGPRLDAQVRRMADALTARALGTPVTRVETTRRAIEIGVAEMERELQLGPIENDPKYRYETRPRRGKGET